jgi:hypothetical protein
VAVAEALAELEVRCYLRVLARGPRYLLRRRDKREFVERAVVVAVVGLNLDDVVEDSAWPAELDDTLAEGVVEYEPIFTFLFG